MDKHQWNVLFWNIRGINATDKWDDVKQKIEESACAIVCLQETKRAALIRPILEISLHVALISSNSFPLWTFLVVFLSFGTARFFLGKDWKRNHMRLQLISLQIMTRVNGDYLLFMALATNPYAQNL